MKILYMYVYNIIDHELMTIRINKKQKLMVVQREKGEMHSAWDIIYCRFVSELVVAVFETIIQLLGRFGR